MTLRLWRIQVLVAGIVLSVMVLSGGRGVSQIKHAPEDGRDEHRAERRMDELQREHDHLRLDIERRLVRIETYLNALAVLITGIAVAVGGQWGVRLFDLVALRRAATIRKDRQD